MFQTMSGCPPADLPQSLPTLCLTALEPFSCVCWSPMHPEGDTTFVLVFIGEIGNNTDTTKHKLYFISFLRSHLLVERPASGGVQRRHNVVAEVTAQPRRGRGGRSGAATIVRVGSAGG